jgi:hypothetical protein
MVLPQSLDLGTLLLISVGCVLLCVVGLLLMFGLQILGTGLSTIMGIFELFNGIISGGPVAWCGCLVVLFLCIGVIGTIFLYTSCQANPAAMNFCQLLPR